MPGTQFCKNLNALVELLEISKTSLYNTDVEHQGVTRRVSRRTLENILKGAVEPRRDIKLVLLKIVRALCPELRDEITLPDLESAAFDAKGFLHANEDSGPWKKFDVDLLIRLINKIVNTSKSRTELVSRFLGIPIEDAKKQFWSRIRHLLRRHEIKNTEFNTALVRGGMPPLPPQKSTLDYATQILERRATLSADHRLIWRVAVAAYPPFTDDSDPELKDAARWLAKFWDRSILFTRERWGFSIASDLGTRRPQERTHVYLLSWLELPLVTQTGNIEPGKSGLFELGRWFQDQS